jgi:predicted ester cyclase
MADNKETVRRMFDEVINLGKLDLIEELWDPDFRSETPQGALDLEAFKAFVAAWREGFSDLHTEVGDLVAEDDRVAWSVRATGTHTGYFMGIAPTGRSNDFDSLNIGQFRDGRAYRHKVLMDIPKLMAQLGQVPG